MQGRTCEQIQLLPAAHPGCKNDLACAPRAIFAVAEDECTRGERFVSVFIALAAMVFLEDLARADGD